jgi:hypothetical protein
MKYAYQPANTGSNGARRVRARAVRLPQLAHTPLDLRDDHRHGDIRALVTKQRPNANRFRGIVTITKARAEPFYSLGALL